jgi:ADP-ribosylglycohydrolase
MKTLLIVDLQNDFLPGGPLAVADGDRIVPVVNELLPAYDLVVATQDWHPENHGSFADSHPGREPGEIIQLDGLEQVLWPVHCVGGTPGADFAPGLDVTRLDHIVRKGGDPMVDSYSGFHDNGRRHATGMTEYLQDQGVAEVHVVGLATDYCVRCTALDAVREGFRTTVINDACRGVDMASGDVERALAEMRKAGVVIANSRDILGKTGEHNANIAGSIEVPQTLTPHPETMILPHTINDGEAAVLWSGKGTGQVMTLDPDRYRGALLGMAAGDALGTTVEFKPRGTFAPLTGIVGGGPFGLKAGEWTDDTSMALCLADSLIACQGMDLADQAERFVAWWRQGENSVTGSCFDIGNTVRSALARYRSSGVPESGSTHPRSAGNGSIMRLAPVPMFFAHAPEQAVKAAAASSKTTHRAVEAVDACRLFAALIVGALHGHAKDALLDPDFAGEFAGLDGADLAPAIDAIRRGNYKTTDRNNIRGTGYVVDSLRAALWAFWNSGSFAEGALLAVNLGDDADTTGAVFGQLAGAHYGAAGISPGWLELLAWRDRITGLADKLLSLAQQSENQ